MSRRTLKINKNTVAATLEPIKVVCSEEIELPNLDKSDNKTKEVVCEEVNTPQKVEPERVASCTIIPPPKMENE